MYTKDFYYFVSILTNANVNEDRLRQMKVDYFTVFSFFRSNLCFKILNYNFLLSQLQITVILLLPLNPENPSLFFLITWNSIYRRLNYGFQSTGAHFLDLASIHLQPEERPESLFQRLMAFFEDNLLSVHGGLTHRWRPLPHTREHCRRPLAPVDTPRLTFLSETKIWFWIAQ